MAPGLVAVLVVLFALGGGAWWWTHRGDGLPDRLGPYTRSDSQAQRDAVAGLDQVLSSTSGGQVKDVRMAVYGTQGGGAILAVYTAAQPLPADATTKLQKVPGAQTIGSDVCLTQTVSGETFTMCFRVTGDTLLLVAGTGVGTDPATVAQWTDQAAAKL
jgi:hypothetical protein